MKATWGDKALVWGTIGGFILTGIGFTVWLTNVAATASNTAQEQQATRQELSKKLDSIATKVDTLNERTSRIEGKLGQ